MSGTHKNQTENHRPHTWEFANAAARIAFTGYTAPTTDSVGKWARQLDDNSYWTLTDDSPITWSAVTGGASSTDFTAHVALDSTQTVHGHTSWEMIQDMLVAVLLGSASVTVVYDDTLNTFTFSTPTAGDLTTHGAIDATQTVHGHVSYEMIQDMVASLITSSDLGIVYNDAGDAISVNATSILAALAALTSTVSSLSGVVSAITPASLQVPRSFGWFMDGDVALVAGYGPIYKLDVNTHITKLVVNVKTDGIGDTHFRMYVSSDLSSWSTVGIITDIVVLTSGTKSAEFNYGSGGATDYTAGLWIRLDVDAVGGTPPKNATVQVFGHLF